MKSACDAAEHLRCGARFARPLRELLPPFLAQYPKVGLVGEVADRVVDIVAEGDDLAIRGHWSALGASALIRRRLATVAWLVFGGGSYAEEKGVMADLGIAVLPARIGRREVTDGALVPLRQAWIAMKPAFSAIIPYLTGIPPGVRALPDHLAVELPRALAPTSGA